MMIVVHVLPTFSAVSYQLDASNGWKLKLFSMTVAIAISDRIARGEDPHEQEQRRHADDGAGTHVVDRGADVRPASQEPPSHRVGWQQGRPRAD